MSADVSCRKRMIRDRTRLAVQNGCSRLAKLVKLYYLAIFNDSRVHRDALARPNCFGGSSPKTAGYIYGKCRSANQILAHAFLTTSCTFQQPTTMSLGFHKALYSGDDDSSNSDLEDDNDVLFMGVKKTPKTASSPSNVPGMNLGLNPLTGSKLAAGSLSGGPMASGPIASGPISGGRMSPPLGSLAGGRLSPPLMDLPPSSSLSSPVLSASLSSSGPSSLDGTSALSGGASFSNGADDSGWSDDDESTSHSTLELEDVEGSQNPQTIAKGRLDTGEPDTDESKVETPKKRNLPSFLRRDPVQDIPPVITTPERTKDVDEVSLDEDDTGLSAASEPATVHEEEKPIAPPKPKRIKDIFARPKTALEPSKVEPDLVSESTSNRDPPLSEEMGVLAVSDRNPTSSVSERQERSAEINHSELEEPNHVAISESNDAAAPSSGLFSEGPTVFGHPEEEIVFEKAKPPAEEEYIGDYDAEKFVDAEEYVPVSGPPVESESTPFEAKSEAVESTEYTESTVDEGVDGLGHPAVHEQADNEVEVYTFDSSAPGADYRGDDVGYRADPGTQLDQNQGDRLYQDDSHLLQDNYSDQYYQTQNEYPPVESANYDHDRAYTQPDPYGSQEISVQDVKPSSLHDDNLIESRQYTEPAYEQRGFEDNNDAQFAPVHPRTDEHTAIDAEPGLQLSSEPIVSSVERVNQVDPTEHRHGVTRFEPTGEQANVHHEQGSLGDFSEVYQANNEGIATSIGTRSSRADAGGDSITEEQVRYDEDYKGQVDPDESANRDGSSPSNQRKGGLFGFFSRNKRDPEDASPPKVDEAATSREHGSSLETGFRPDPSNDSAQGSYEGYETSGYSEDPPLEGDHGTGSKGVGTGDEVDEEEANRRKRIEEAQAEAGGGSVGVDLSSVCPQLILLSLLIVAATLGTAFWGTLLALDTKNLAVNSQPQMKSPVARAPVAAPVAVIAPAKAPTDTPSTAPTECQNTQSSIVDFRLTFDARPKEVGFSLVEAGGFGSAIWDMGPGTFKSFNQFNKKNVFRLCLSKRPDFTFEIVDTASNGLVADFAGADVYGSWELQFNDQIIASYEGNCSVDRSEARQQANPNALFACGVYCKCTFSLGSNYTGGKCTETC